MMSEEVGFHRGQPCSVTDAGIEKYKGVWGTGSRAHVFGGLVLGRCSVGMGLKSLLAT